jgi:deoxyribose-phosphate aldolase
VIGFPHGNSTTESKRYETELACKDGAAEIDMVINIGKALGGDWDYVEADVKAVCDEAHRHGAKVKVIFENDYLTAGGAGLSSDDFKIKLCQLCERAGADWVKTSSGYGFVKQADGSYNYKGATEHDLALMRASVSPKVQVKAAGGVRDLDGLIKVRDLGGSRCGATATAVMMDEYRLRQPERAEMHPARSAQEATEPLRQGLRYHRANAIDMLFARFGLRIGEGHLHERHRRRVTVLQTLEDGAAEGGFWVGQARWRSFDHRAR